MPNYCSNTLTIKPINSDKKSKAELEKFINDVKVSGEKLTLKEAREYREKYIKENFDEVYSDAADLFVEHSKMSIKNFMIDVLYYRYDLTEKIFEKGHSDFSMNKLIPCPVELTDARLYCYGGEENDKLRAEMKKKYGYENSLGWNMNNFGCKWDVGSVSVTKEKNCVTYNFDTAWNPITNFLENICDRYPLLEFHLFYEEPGNDFEGDLYIEGGEVVEHDQRAYSGTIEEDEDF